jgi:hypothetical protein
MVISFPALVCLEATWRHILARTGRKTADLPQPVSMFAGAEESWSGELEPALPEAETTILLASQSSPVDPADDPVSSGPLTATERRARAAALRGLALSRARRFEAAQRAFAEAARLDPLLDLTRTPGFWSLERGAHEAAIAAYGVAARDGDAAVLRARVHATYRPKPLRASGSALVLP